VTTRPEVTLGECLVDGEYLSSRWLLHFVPGLTYRQLDYWTRLGLLRSRRWILTAAVSTHRPAEEMPGAGSGVPRLYCASDIQPLRRVVQLLLLGMDLRLAFRLARQPGPTVQATHDIRITFDGDLEHAYTRTA
jgi:hypothetical protein